MTRVIKIGGRPQADPSLPALIAESWDALSGAMILVHGGGDEVSALQEQLGISAQFVDGRRVTSAQDLELVRMALSGTANKRLVASLVREGVRAVGLSGEDASLIAATPGSRGRSSAREQLAAAASHRRGISPRHFSREPEHRSRIGLGAQRQR
jgi:acetylglutamate kinase